jgi:sulfur relay (sulfurtransferase) DsrC/TusE family protein
MQSPNIDENDEEYKAAIVNAINTLERCCVYKSINYIKNENGLCINLVKIGNNEDSENNRYYTINALFQNIFAISSKTLSDNKTKDYILYKKKSARVAAEVQARKKQIAAVKENTEILETKINTDKDPYLYSDIVPVEVIIENMKRFSGNDLTKNIRPLIKYVTEFNNEFQLSEILQKRQPESLSQYYLQKIIHKKDLFSKHHFFGKLNLSGSNIDSIINKNNYNYAGFSDDFSLLFLSLCCCEEFALVREPLFKLINSPEELLRQHLTKNMDIFLKNVHLDESGVPAFIPYDFFKDLFGKTNLILYDFAESILSKAVGYLTAWCNQSSVDFTKDGYIALNKIVVKPDLLETFYSEAFKIWDATTNDVEVKSYIKKKKSEKKIKDQQEKEVLKKQQKEVEPLAFDKLIEIFNDKEKQTISFTTNKKKK